MTEKEAASVLNNVVDSLRNNPLVIGLLVLNMLFVLASVYFGVSRSQHTRDVIIEILRECRGARQYVPQSSMEFDGLKKQDRINIGVQN